MTNNPHPTRDRWAYFAVVSGLSVAGFCFLFLACGAVGRSTWPWFAPTSGVVQLAARALVATAIVGLILRLTPIRGTQLWYVVWYPPTWLALGVGFLGACAMDFLGLLGPPDHRPPEWECLGLGALGLAVVGVVSRLNASPSKTGQKKSPVASGRPSIDWAAVEPWLQAESPAEHDLLYRLPVARRIARRLVAPVDTDPTIGVVGPFGSGKSSIVRWVEDQAKASGAHAAGTLWFCQVSCWGFEDSASAVQHILSRVLREVGKHADCFSISHVPDAYRKALSAGGAWWPSVADLFFGQADPTGALKRLAPVLQALKVRLVLVVEDLDRNKSARFDAADVQATLQRLREVPGVSFILTGESTPESDIDFARLCDHIEVLAPAAAGLVLNLIIVLRRQCLSMVAINPNESPDRTEETLWGSLAVREQVHLHSGLDGMPMARAVVELLSTPRALNHAMRHTWTAWQALHGEVDFDDLLAANALRYGAPDAFNFLLRTMDRLRMDVGGGPTQSGRGPGDWAHHMQQDWEPVAGDLEGGAAAALELICFLVPNAKKAIQGKPPANTRCPQGVRHSAPTDYMRRVVHEELPENAVRDQDVLRAIREWMDDPTPDKSLVQCLARSVPFAEVWGHFEGRVDGRKPLRLAEQVIDAVLAAEGAAASADNMGVAAMLHRLATYGVDDSNNRVWLEGIIRSTLPRSIILAYELYSRCTNPSWGFMQLSDKPEVRAGMVQAARSVFGGTDPGPLMAALHKAKPYALRWLVLSPGDDRYGPCGAEQWDWLADQLSAALKREPAKMAIQIGHLLLDHVGDGHESRGVLIVDRVKALFGDQAKSLVELLGHVVGDVPEDHRELLGVLKEQALECLARKALDPEAGDGASSKNSQQQADSVGTLPPGS